MSARAWTLLALLASVVATAAAAAPKTIVEAVAEDPKLSELSKFLKKNPAVAGIMGPGFTGTLLAPTDAAVKYAKQLGINLSPFLLNFHILPTATRVADMKDGDVLPTLDTEPLTVIYSDGDLNLVSSGSAAKVVKADKTVGDAVLHVIDSVLLPVPEEDLAEAEIAAAFAAAKTATAAAIVGRGDKKRGEGADAAGTVAADSLDAASMEGPASNEGGLLDQVSPGAVAAAIAAASAASEGSVEASNIDAATLEDALVAANLTAMLADVEALGLLDTLRNGDFTIFAPSADVYEAVTSAGLDTAALKQLLLSHVIEGTLTAEDLAKRTNLTTLGGTEILVETVAGRTLLLVSGMPLTAVVSPDFMGGSTVVHTIDGLLAPTQAEAAAPAPLAAPEVPPSAAVSRSGAAVLVAALAVAAAAMLA